MHNYVIVLLNNLCMTLLFYFLLNKLFARLRFSQNQLILLIEKIGQNAVSQHGRRGSSRNFKQFKVFCTSNREENEG